MSTLVTSRLDYCCSLLAGITQRDMHRIQSVQNKAARIVTRSQGPVSIKPLLFDLHWLPCHLRVEFRIMVFVFKCLNNEAPEYLSSLLGKYIPGRCLRSSTDTSQLVKPMSKKKIGERAFGTAAPTLWNQLPVEIRRAATITQFSGHEFR